MKHALVQLPFIGLKGLVKQIVMLRPETEHHFPLFIKVCRKPSIAQQMHLKGLCRFWCITFTHHQRGMVHDIYGFLQMEAAGRKDLQNPILRCVVGSTLLCSDIFYHWLKGPHRILTFFVCKNSSYNHTKTSNDHNQIKRNQWQVLFLNWRSNMFIIGKGVHSRIKV